MSKNKLISLSVLMTFLTIPFAANACSIHFKVVNNSGEYMRNIFVAGPWGRKSSENGQDLPTLGSSFTYHAEGSAFSCHGHYWLAFWDYHQYEPSIKKHDYEKDTYVTATITDQCKKVKGRGYYECAVKWSPSSS